MDKYKCQRNMYGNLANKKSERSDGSIEVGQRK
jgi:hypothetical protein